MHKLENERIHVVDSLRGFALAGIVIVHMAEMYLAASPSDEMATVLLGTPLDLLVDEVMYYGIWGKFFSLFSILFGLSFFIQMDSAARRGVDFKEPTVADERRMDIVITCQDKRYVIELKRWHGEKYHQRGLQQLSDYLDIYSLKKGYLLIYDFNKGKSYKEEQIQFQDKEIFAVWV